MPSVEVAVSGSSPLTRGKRPDRWERASSVRHPRSRGENPLNRHAFLPCSGSSPLTRGKRDQRGPRVRLLGLIPAHAGKTRAACPCRGSVRAHPRSRGENRDRGVRCDPYAGSSPLTRGKLFEAHRANLVERLIPAHAGKTLLAWGWAARMWAHPRSRGENRPHDPRRARGHGSSPLTRGKRPRRSRRQRREGLIPAHAGKTTGTPGSTDGTAAHPRSRGENIQSPSQTVKTSGSSPLTRGKRSDRRRNARYGRLIPAHAGKT